MTTTDESTRERRHASRVRAAASVFCFFLRRLGSLTLKRHLRGWSEVLKYRPRCIYRGLARILGQSLGSSCCLGDVLLFYFFRPHPRGTLCAWAQLVPQSPFLEVHDLSRQSLPSTKPKQPTDCSRALARSELEKQRHVGH